MSRGRPLPKQGAALLRPPAHAHHPHHTPRRRRRRGREPWLRLVWVPLVVVMVVWCILGGAQGQSLDDDNDGPQLLQDVDIAVDDKLASFFTNGLDLDNSNSETLGDKSSFFGRGSGASGGGDPNAEAKTALNHGPTPPETDPVYLSRAQSIRDAPGRDPVIVLNGLGGAGLQFRLRGAKPMHHYCRTWYARWHTAWILPRVMVPPVARCLMDFITPIYDPLTKKFRSKPGVEVKVEGFGKIVSLENLGPSILPLRNFDYIRGFVKFMVTELGYGPGLDLFAAPYDWRFTPDVLKEQGYFRDLKALVETAYVTAGNRRVHIMGHSLGGVVSLAFLNDMPLEWKQRYIKSYIPVGSPFGGTVVNLMGSCSGYNLGLPLAPADLRDFEAQAPTGPWLFPQPSMWGREEVLVQTPTQHYSAHDYERLLIDLGLGEVALPVYKHVAPLYLETLIPPGIDVHVVHSTGNPTVASLVYNQTFNGSMAEIPFPPVLVFGPGDGTVPERSLLRPFKEWCPPSPKEEGGREGGGEGGWVLTHHTMEGVNHMDICNFRGFFRVLTDILSNNVERTLRPDADARETAPDPWKTRMKQTWAPIEAALDAAEEMVFGP